MSLGVAPGEDAGASATESPALATEPLMNLVPLRVSGDSEFKKQFKKLVEQNAKAEMAKMVKTDVEGAVALVIETGEAIAQGSSDELEKLMTELREAWKTSIKSEFAERTYEYYSTVQGANKKDRLELKKRFDLAWRDYQGNLERKDGLVFSNIVEEFEQLGAYFDQVRDMYYSSESWRAYAACYDEPLREGAADLHRACTGYIKCIEARDRIDLKDPAYEAAVKRKATLVSKGYDKKKVDPAPTPEAPTPTPTPAPQPAAAALSVPMTFEVVPAVDTYQRPIYTDDEIYEIWPSLDLKAKGSSVSFKNLSGGPALVRVGSADVQLDTNGDGKGDEKLPITGNITPVKTTIGKGPDERPWAFLAAVGNPKDVYQGIQVNLGSEEKRMTIYTFGAASFVGELNGTSVRIIDDTLDGVYGTTPQRIGYPGLSKDVWQPDLDAIVIGTQKRARPWSQHQEIDGQWYKLEVAGNGKELKATPASFDTGVLMLDFKGPVLPTWVVVVGTGDLQNTYFDLVEGGPKGVRVPAGKYSLFYGEVRKGKKLQAQKTLILPGKTPPTWQVKKDATVVVELGAPFGFDFHTTYEKEKLTVTGRSVVITGSKGERYERPWNCVPRAEVSWRKKGSKRSSKLEKMTFVMDNEGINKNGWEATWAPMDLVLECRGAGDSVEVQISDKKHDLFGKIESEWKE